jgi:nucleoid-associated protein YgaU
VLSLYEEREPADAPAKIQRHDIETLLARGDCVFRNSTVALECFLASTYKRKAISMRLFIAIILLLGGGLAAIATTWFFLQTSEDISELEKTEAARIAQPELSAKSNEAAEQTAATSKTEEVLPAIVMPTIDVARIGPDGSAVFAGLADTKSTVTLFENDQLLTQSSANSQGEWVAVVDKPLSPGKHLIIAEMTRLDGTTQRAERAILVELSATENDTPLVALVPMTDNAVVALLQAPKELAHSDTATVTVDDVLVAAPEIYIGTLSWAGTTSLRIKGMAKQGIAVAGTLGRLSFGPVEVTDAGTWQAIIDSSLLGNAPVMLTALLLDKESEAIAKTGFEVMPAQLEIGRDGSEMVVIQKGDMLWRIAYRTYGNGIRYLDIVNRNKARINNPDLIFPTQIFALPKTD